MRGALEVLLREPPLGRVWTIHVEEEAVGGVILTFGYDLEFGGPVANITEFYISPSHRRSLYAIGWTKETVGNSNFVDVIDSPTNAVSTSIALGNYATNL